jgi:2-amino-4-hydroxy-6-hydroxymethyldihydropteridine diphosphokinase
MGDPISSFEREANSAPKSTGRVFVVGLGTNLGDRLELLHRASAELDRFARVEGVASLWESEAVGPPQDRYWNSALLLRGAASAGEIVTELLAIEASLGRVRTLRWGPRVIDLDLLWIDGEVSTDPRCEVPHPRLHERSFALTPLLELVAAAVDPRTGAPFAEATTPTLERIGVGATRPLGWRLLAR